MRAVVGRVHDEGVVRDAGIVDRLEHRADILVVVNHGVVVGALEATRLTDALRLRLGAEVHVRKVHPQEDRLVGLDLPLDEVRRPSGDVIVDGLHPLLGQRAGVLDGLLANLSRPRLHGFVVFVRSLAVQHATRTVFRAERGILRV